MKKTLLLSSLLVFALLLSACAAQGSNRGFGSGSTRALSPEAKLAIGTIKLEGTKQAVDPAMAAKLLPLWQVLKQLNSSDSAAPQEVTAVLDQIRSTMNPAQVSAIDAMQITRQDMFSVFQQEAQAGGTGSTSGTGSTGASGFRSGNGGNGNRGNGGGFFFGGGGGGGGFGGGGFGGSGFNRSGTGTGTGNGTTNGSQQSGSSAQRSQAFANGLNTALINQVIQLLQSKMAS